MITAPHMITGAAVGKMSRRWWVVLPIAFASHFVLDYIPHIESTVLFDVVGKPLVRVVVGGTSLLLALGLTTWALIGQSRWRLMLAGAVTATLIDLVESPPGLERILSTWPGSSWLYAFHHGFHHSLPKDQWLVGVATQAAVLILALYIARRIPTEHPGHDPTPSRHRDSGQ